MNIYIYIYTYIYNNIQIHTAFQCVSKLYIYRPPVSIQLYI